MVRLLFFFFFFHFVPIQLTYWYCLLQPLITNRRNYTYNRVIVLAVHLLNAHTWGINASYSVFLAYYLRSGAFAGASPIAYAFVGGLSISIGV